MQRIPRACFQDQMNQRIKNYFFISGCQSDSDCLDKETCHVQSGIGTCINPCLIEDPCGANAVCFPQSHVANCRCNEGFEGDPFVGKLFIN